MGVLVGKKAPDFSATAVVNGEIKENFKLSSFAGKNVVLFFYPLDFTFVCPTELTQFRENLSHFEKEGAEVIVQASTSDVASQGGQYFELPKGQDAIVAGGLRFKQVGCIDGERTFRSGDRRTQRRRCRQPTQSLQGRTEPDCVDLR